MIKILKKILERGPAPYGTKGSRSGFVLLFSVVLTSIILAITLGVSNISLKELTFSTSAKDSNTAFYAADTGAECALYYDKTPAPILDPNSGTSFVYIFGVPTENVTTVCNGVAIALNEDAEGQVDTDGPWVFNLTSLGSEGRACALVEVTKTANQTIIISKGYNFGHIPNYNGTDAPNCASDSPNQVERVIEVRY